MGRIILSDFKMCSNQNYMVLVKTDLDPWNRTENPEIATHKYNQLLFLVFVFYNGAKAIQWKNSLCNKLYGRNHTCISKNKSITKRFFLIKKINLNLNFTCHTKSNLNLIIDSCCHTRGHAGST